MPLFNAPGWLLKAKRKADPSLKDTGISDEELDNTVTFVPYTIHKVQMDRKSSSLTFMFASNGQSGGEIVKDFEETMIWFLFDSNSDWTKYFDTGKTVNLLKLDGWYTTNFKSYDNKTKERINNCDKLYVVFITKNKKYAASDNRTGDKDFRVDFEANDIHHRP